MPEKTIKNSEFLNLDPKLLKAIEEQTKTLKKIEKILDNMWNERQPE